MYGYPRFSPEFLLLSASPCRRADVILKQDRTSSFPVVDTCIQHALLSFTTLDSLLTYIIYGARSLIPVVKTGSLEPVLNHIYPVQTFTMYFRVQLSITCRQTRIYVRKIPESSHLEGRERNKKLILEWSHRN